MTRIATRTLAIDQAHITGYVVLCAMISILSLALLGLMGGVP